MERAVRSGLGALLMSMGLAGCAAPGLDLELPCTSPADPSREPGRLLDTEGEVPLWGAWVCTGRSEEARSALEDARNRCDRGDLRGALEHLDAAVERHPDEAGLLEARGCVMARMGFSRAAEKEFQRAAGMRPGASGPWWALGFVRLELGLPRAAGEALRSAHALGERDPELLVLLARVARLEGDVETAVESYAQALARDPSADADRLVEAATLFLEDELNDPTRRWVALAVGWLDRAEDVHPGDGRLSDVRALILARHGP